LTLDARRRAWASCGGNADERTAACEDDVIELSEKLAAWMEEGIPVGRAVVVRAFGSSPRPEGSTMLATADGRIAGSISGGCVDGAAVEEIQMARAHGRSRVIRYGISDEAARGIGLACGGTIDVLIEPRVSGAVEQAARLAAGLETDDTAPSGDDAGSADGPGRGSAVVTPLPADAPGPEIGPHRPGSGELPGTSLVVRQDGGLDGSTGEVAADVEMVAQARGWLDRGLSRTVEIAGRQYFVEVFPARPRLLIVGAGQVAVPLVELARTLGYETIVADGRAAFATRERFPTADRVLVGWPDEVAAEIGLGPADSVAVLSHDPKFDEPAIAIALARGCRYVGAIGSRKTQADRRERLVAEGLPAEEVERLRGPIGLDLGGRSPAETALAIIAEIVAMRRGGTGLSLRDKAGGQAAG
jgi:xanthine dehydrogenase accessory factor